MSFNISLQQVSMQLFITVVAVSLDHFQFSVLTNPVHRISIRTVHKTILPLCVVATWLQRMLAVESIHTTYVKVRYIIISYALRDDKYFHISCLNRSKLPRRVRRGQLCKQSKEPLYKGSTNSPNKGSQVYQEQKKLFYMLRERQEQIITETLDRQP